MKIERRLSPEGYPMIQIFRTTITVYFEHVGDDIAASTKITPLLHDDGTEDIRALEDFECFVVNTLEIFDEHDYVILDEHTSPKSHSEYYTLVKRDQLEEMSCKHILFIRISDHKNREQSTAQRRKYYSELADSLKQPPTKARQTWRLKEITVNHETYFSYEDALEDIDKRLD